MNVKDLHQINEEEGLPKDNLGKREAKLLNQNLISDERVISTCVGSYGQAVVLTNKKVLIIKCGIFAGQTFGGKVSTYNYDTITSVEVRIGLSLGVFEIATGGVQGYEKSVWGSGNNDAYKAPNCVPFRKRQSKGFQNIANYIREHKHQINHQINQNLYSQSQDIPDQIKKLDDLHRQGILTTEEFENKKKELLTRL